MDGHGHKGVSGSHNPKSLPKAGEANGGRKRRTTYSGPEHTDAEEDEAVWTTAQSSRPYASNIAVIARRSKHRDGNEELEYESSSAEHSPALGRQKSMPVPAPDRAEPRTSNRPSRRASAKAAHDRPHHAYSLSAASGTEQRLSKRPTIGINGAFKDAVASHLMTLQKSLVEEYDHRHWRLERQAAMLSEENKILKDEIGVLLSKLAPEDRKVEEPKVRNIFALQIAAKKFKGTVQARLKKKSLSQAKEEGVDGQAPDSDEHQAKKKRASTRKSIRKSGRGRVESMVAMRRGTLRDNDECEKASAAKQLVQVQNGTTVLSEVVSPPELVSEAWSPTPPDSSEVQNLPEIDDLEVTEIGKDDAEDVPGVVAEETLPKADYSKRKSLVQFGGEDVKEMSRVSRSSSPESEEEAVVEDLEQSDADTTEKAKPEPAVVVSPRPETEEGSAPKRTSILKAQSKVPVAVRGSRTSIRASMSRENGDPAPKSHRVMSCVEEGDLAGCDESQSGDSEEEGEYWDGSSDEEESSEEELFEVLELWTTDYFEKFNIKGAQTARTTVVRGSTNKDNDSTMGVPPSLHSASVVWLDDLDTRGWEGFMMKFVVLPTSWMRLLWDFFGCMFILYDVVVIPLESFSPPENTFTRMMAWLARIFWTFDILMNFFTGYLEPHGMMELRPTKVAGRYAMSWFPIDLGILLCEWAEVFASGSAQAWFRRVPWLRITRIIRLRRLMRSWEFVNVTIHSDLGFLIAGVMRNVLGILLLSHFVACCWYRLIRAEQGATDQFADEALPTMWSKYAWAFHWATMQFTGLGLHSLPRLDNPAQVIYSISSMYLTFVISASFVSVITTSMTRYHITNDQNLVQFGMLRKYLVDNHISPRLSMRMQQNAHHVVAERNRYVPEGDIELLELISDPLRVELHFELYIPHLTHHSFFDLYSEKYPAAIRQVCHHAISQMSFFAGDLIFGDGEKPVFPRMFFILSGKLEYAPCCENHRKQDLHKGQTISEAVLWTDWMHQGTLKVLTECRILALDAEKFQNIAVQFRVGNFPPEIYARQFVDALNSVEGPLTDMVSESQSALMVKRAFGTGEKRNKRAMSSYNKGSSNSCSEYDTKRHGSWISGGGSIVISVANTFASALRVTHAADGGETVGFEKGSEVASVLPGDSFRISSRSELNGVASHENGDLMHTLSNRRTPPDRPSRVSFAVG